MASTTARRITLLCAALLCGGCEVFTIGAPLAAKTYHEHTTLEVVVDCYQTELHRASVAALEELDMVVESEELDEQEGEVVGRTAWGESVTVGSEQEVGQNSVLTIRVGLMGDEATSWDIYRAIKRQLYRSGLINFASHRPARPKPPRTE